MARELRGIIAARPEPGRIIAILEQDARSSRDAAHALDVKLTEIAAAADDRAAVPDAAQLAAYLRERGDPPGIGVSNVDAAIGGYSKQTVRFDRVWPDGRVEPLVMRRDLHVANIGTTVLDEFAILRAVHATGFPVAEPLWLDPGSTAMAGPLLVSRRMPGVVTGNPLGLAGAVDFDPAAALAGLLAQLHAIDVDALEVRGYSDIVFDETEQRARIAEWRGNYERNVDQPTAALEVGLAWLEENTHLAIGPKVLVHGEVGFHNLLFDGTDISALLDWELAHAGNAADDLAYVRRFVEPYGSFESFLGLYAAAGGWVPPRHSLLYFEVFGNVRNAILGVMGIRHFNDGAHHDLPLLRIIMATAAAYTDRLTELLGSVIREHGFRWNVEEAP